MGQSSHRFILEIVESKHVTEPRISEEQAVTVAADATQVMGLPAAAHIVERLDGQHPYFLVHFGKPGGPGAAVMVDAVDGSVMAHAKVERVQEPWLIDEQRAAEIAGCAQPMKARLVWMPSRATRSPFYPLWEIAGPSGRVWVDQSGGLHHELVPAGPG